MILLIISQTYPSVDTYIQNISAGHNIFIISKNRRKAEKYSKYPS